MTSCATGACSKAASPRSAPGSSMPFGGLLGTWNAGSAQVAAERKAVIRRQEVALPERLGDIRELPRRVHGLARLGERTLVDVGCVDLHPLLVIAFAERLREEHRDRVRLLARCAARRPDADRLVLLEQLRNHLSRDDGPRLLVSEEPGDVDEDHVEALDELVRVALEC